MSEPAVTLHEPAVTLHEPAVTLYGRPGCCLCDDAREVLERMRARVPFELREVDIESDDALLKAYLELIPVVAIDGEEVFRFFVDEVELERRLRGQKQAGRQVE